ncbi:MAG TPA: hypothetical protein VKA70_07980 [Blastocatellia bacterium]|nr:hypothetical protein [Blastocatellia bacterium]
MEKRYTPERAHVFIKSICALKKAAMSRRASCVPDRVQGRILRDALKPRRGDNLIARGNAPGTELLIMKSPERAV